MPLVHSTPSGFTVFSVIDNEVLKKDPVEKWGAPDFVAWQKKYPTLPVAPSMVGRLKTMKLFRERVLSRDQEDMLKAVTVKGENGCQTSMGRTRFLTLYGYHGTPAEQLLEERFPCHQLVFPSTGHAATKSSHLTGPCGEKRFCQNCEKVFAIIDESFPTYVVCDVLLALFTKVAPTWSGQVPVDSTMWARKSDVGRQHKCGPSCPGHL